MKKFSLPLSIYLLTLGLLMIQNLPFLRGEFSHTFFMISLVLPAGLALMVTKKELVDWGIHFQMVWQQIKWALGSSVAILGAFGIGFFLYLRIQGTPWEFPREFPLGKMVYLHLFLVALPEEIFFRGYLQTHLQDIHTPSSKAPYLAILETSALFALAHGLVYLTPLRLNVFFPSLAFGFVRWKSKSLGPAVILHGFSNVVYLFLLSGI